MEQHSFKEIRVTEGYQAASAMGRKPIPCDAERCEQDSIGSLELRALCLGHFISHCYQRLERWTTFAYDDPAGTTPESNDRFLEECLRGAENLLRTNKSIDNLGRARLFDIFLWASEVSAKRNHPEKASKPERSRHWQTVDSRPTP